MRLNRRLPHQVNRRLGAFVTTRTDARPYRPPNYLQRACDAIAPYLRLRQKMAKREPHLFGPHASRYYRDTVAEAARQAQIDVALDKVYGPSSPETPPPRSVWEERYAIPPEQLPTFRKWFREKYG